MLPSDGRTARRTSASPCAAIASMKARISAGSAPAAAAWAAEHFAVLAGHVNTATAASNARRRQMHCWHCCEPSTGGTPGGDTPRLLGRETINKDEELIGMLDNVPINLPRQRTNHRADPRQKSQRQRRGSQSRVSFCVAAYQNGLRQQVQRPRLRFQPARPECALQVHRPVSLRHEAPQPLPPSVAVRGRLASLQKRRVPCDALRNPIDTPSIHVLWCTGRSQSSSICSACMSRSVEPFSPRHSVYTSA